MEQRFFQALVKRPRQGRDVLKEHPESTGSLGIAISEAVEDAANHDDTNYALGSSFKPRFASPNDNRP